MPTRILPTFILTIILLFGLPEAHSQPNGQRQNPGPATDAAPGDIRNLLQLMLVADHRDRALGLHTVYPENDSIRYTVVRKLVEGGKVVHWVEKYCAAYILYRGGGPLVKDKAWAYATSAKLFTMVHNESTDPAIRQEALEKALDATSLWMAVATRSKSS
jgi:hypothetical protein